MDDIRIDVGVYTSLEVDLTAFDFTGVSKVILTVKNRCSSEAIIEREFTAAARHYVTITPAESMSLHYGAEYDFNIITADGKRYKNGGNGRVIFRLGVGTCSG